MANIVEYFQSNFDWTATVGATPVVGGRLVEFSGDRTVVPAGAGSLVVAGVARQDAAVGAKVAVGSDGVFPLTASGAITAGAAVVAAASGQVAAAGVTPDARTVVGYAMEAISNGAVGRVRLTR